ncbi:MAG: ferritin-like domain-containing protein [Malacoplasma sp.]
MFKKEIEIINILNDYYNLELQAANMYLNYSTVINKLGYVHVAKFVKNLADDKLEAHLSRIYDYFISISNEIIINEYAIPKKHAGDLSAKELIKNMLNNELELRNIINNLADFLLTKKDYESFEFIQWFVKDSIKDINDVSDVLNYFESPNSNLLSIEAATRHKIDSEK